MRGLKQRKARLQVVALSVFYESLSFSNSEVAV
jgi:hypothetical protein